MSLRNIDDKATNFVWETRRFNFHIRCSTKINILQNLIHRLAIIELWKQDICLFYLKIMILVKIFVGSRQFFQLITEHIVLGWSAGSSAHDWNQYKFKVEETNQLITKIYRVGQTFFSKERNILAFFYILYKRTLCSLHSFTFFIKVRGILCVLLRSI